MSDFIQDMKDASERFNKWCDAGQIFDEDFHKIDTLLQKHYDQRSELFEVLLKILEQDSDSLSDNWERVCDQGLRILDDLDRAIPSTAGDGLKGIGLGSFLDGEKKIWQENGKGKIATMAEIIVAVSKDDVAIAKAAEQDLVNARNEGNSIQEYMRASMDETKNALTELAGKAVEKATTRVAAEIPVIGQNLAPYVSKGIQTLFSMKGKSEDFGKKLKAHKDVLQDNYDKIRKKKEALSEGAIRTAAQQAVDCANSLRDIGSGGDYRAADWETFAKECEKRIRDKSEPAIVNAKYLYDEIRPMYVQAITSTFITLVSNPVNVKAFSGQLDEQTRQIYDALKMDEAAIASLRDGPSKTTGSSILRQIESDVTDAIKALKSALEDFEENQKFGSFD